MIEKIGFLHHLSQAAYGRVCGRFGLQAGAKGRHDYSLTFENSKITGIQLYNIVYKEYGHIWFMHVEMDFARLGCTYDEFPSRLYEAYGECFGSEMADELPPYDSLICDYVEYHRVFAVDDAAARMARAREQYPAAQTEKALWHTFRKPHATIAFCFVQKGGTCIETLARCHGPALKGRIRDTARHRGTGVTPAAAVNAETEREITDWLWHRYM